MCFPANFRGVLYGNGAVSSEQLPPSGVKGMRCAVVATGALASSQQHAGFTRCPPVPPHFSYTFAHLTAGMWSVWTLSSGSTAHVLR